MSAASSTARPAGRNATCWRRSASPSNGQDFYAHTNWSDAAAADQGGPENPPGLGHEGPGLWMDPAPGRVRIFRGPSSAAVRGAPENPPLHLRRGICCGAPRGAQQAMPGGSTGRPRAGPGETLARRGTAISRARSRRRSPTRRPPSPISRPRRCGSMARGTRRADPLCGEVRRPGRLPLEPQKLLCRNSLPSKRRQRRGRAFSRPVCIVLGRL